MAKILMLVEGSRREVRLMKHLLKIFDITEDHQIVIYGTNIYSLYSEMFQHNDPDSMDLLQVLRSRESDPEKKRLLADHYSDILLIFDLDPQDQDYSAKRIREMQDYFKESTDMGKLYINYPMVEAFYHMKSIPDPDYNTYTASIEELKNHRYKSRVSMESRSPDYSKFAVNRRECSIVIQQNVDKAAILTGSTVVPYPPLSAILEKQLDLIDSDSKMEVLFTGGFYIADYNPRLIKEN